MLQACNFVNKKLQHSCFLVNIAKFLTANFFYRTPLVTASVFWTITILKFNRALENLRAMDDFNFPNFLSDKVMGSSTEITTAPVIAAFPKLFQITSFRKCH